MKEFDPALIESPTDLAYDFLKAYHDVARLREKQAKLEHEIAQHDATLAKIDRWLLAVFEANPMQTSLSISSDGREYLLVPDPLMGVIDLIEPGFSSDLKMVPFPVEPDFNDDDGDDDFNDNDIDCGSPNGHPFALVGIEDFHDELYHDQSVS